MRVSTKIRVGLLLPETLCQTVDCRLHNPITPYFDLFWVCLQDFDRPRASRGPSAVAKLLVLSLYNIHIEITSVSLEMNNIYVRKLRQCDAEPYTSSTVHRQRDPCCSCAHAVRAVLIGAFASQRSGAKAA